jgi:Cyclin, C-terminal domain
MDARHDTLELARFLTELSVIDYYFVSKKASSVALAALLNAMEELPEVADAAVTAFAQEIQRVSGLRPDCAEVLDCRERLRLLYAQGGYARPEPQADTRTEAISPVCVSYGLSAATAPTPLPNSQELFPSKATTSPIGANLPVPEQQSQ